MKLLYDVLNYSPQDIKRVVLFATNNALVCDTPDDAMRVAYEIEAQNRYDVSINRFFLLKNDFGSSEKLILAYLFFFVLVVLSWIGTKLVLN